MAFSALHLISTAQYTEGDMEDRQYWKELKWKEAISKDQILDSGQGRGRKDKKQQADVRNFPEIALMQYDEELGLDQGEE